MSRDFETATDQISDLQQRLELFMSACQRCGRCFTPPSPLEKLKLHGYRMDDIERGQWIFVSKSYLEGEKPVEDIELEWD